MEPHSRQKDGELGWLTWSARGSQAAKQTGREEFDLRATSGRGVQQVKVGSHSKAE